MKTKLSQINKGIFFFLFIFLTPLVLAADINDFYLDESSCVHSFGRIEGCSEYTNLTVNITLAAFSSFSCNDVPLSLQVGDIPCGRNVNPPIPYMIKEINSTHRQCTFSLKDIFITDCQNSLDQIGSRTDGKVWNITLAEGWNFGKLAKKEILVPIISSKNIAEKKDNSIIQICALVIACLGFISLFFKKRLVRILGGVILLISIIIFLIAI